MKKDRRTYKREIRNISHKELRLALGQKLYLKRREYWKLLKVLRDFEIISGYNHKAIKVKK